MTDDDYMNATNLAKVRIAKNVMRDFLPADAQDESDLHEIMASLTKLELKIEPKVVPAQ